MEGISLKVAIFVVGVVAVLGISSLGAGEESKQQKKGKTATVQNGEAPARGKKSAKGREKWKAPAKAANVKNPVPANKASLMIGKRIFRRECLSCHGETGRGDGPKSAELDVPAGDFTDPATLGPQTDGELFWKITEGRKPLPSFRESLTEDDRWHVINYIRTLVKPRP